jgi:glycerol-3-phosphate dehydrogenase
MNDENTYDVVVIGGGVVGLAILRAATLEGWKCALVEREDELLSHASGSNSGIACTGVDCSPGTLERALIRDSISHIRHFCREMNVPTRECGSMVCCWPWDEEDRLKEVLYESLDAGDTHAILLSSEQTLEREPRINPSCLGAVHIPGEIVVDPWLYSIALGIHARQNGAHIYTSFEMDPSTSSFVGGIWTIQRVSTTKANNGENGIPDKLKAKAVVNATGLWSDLVQTQVHSSSAWTAKPRRGQYRVYASSSNASLTHPIQPIPTQRTKGIFVFATLYDQIVVGPTALDQESRIDRSVDPVVSDELAHHVWRILPSLDVDAAYVGDYVGIRPGTDKRDYQIHLNSPKNWVSGGAG